MILKIKNYNKCKNILKIILSVLIEVFHFIKQLLFYKSQAIVYLLYK